MLEKQLEQDLKEAMLAGETERVTTLRGLKAALLNVKVANGTRGSDLPDDDVIQVLAKEAKKRQESADLYKHGGDESRAAKELSEKVLIETYLPAKISEEELVALIDEVIASSGVSGPAAMGQVIGQVKAKAGASADGAQIAALVKARLS